MKRSFKASNLDDQQFLRSLGIDPSLARDLADSFDMPFSADDVDEPADEDGSTADRLV